MLTASQCETVGYMTDGGFVCVDCAGRDYSTLTLEKLREGLPNVADGELSPLSRYEVDSYDGERAYETAEEIVNDWCDDHGTLARTFGVDRAMVVHHKVVRYRGQTAAPFGARIGQSYRAETIAPEGTNRWRLIDRVADKLGDTYGARCDDCGEVLS